MHLNLTCTNLSEKVLLKLLSKIQKAESLQGIHLSGNPGVTENLKRKAIKTLGIEKRTPRPKLELSKVLEPATMTTLTDTFIRESVKIKHINSGKRIVQNGATDDKFFGATERKDKRLNIDTKMILQRYMYHEIEIPGSDRWRLLTEKSEHCWLCDCETKGYVFWTPGMATRSKKYMNINQNERSNIFQQLD